MQPQFSINSDSTNGEPTELTSRLSSSLLGAFEMVIEHLKGTLADMMDEDVKRFMVGYGEITTDQLQYWSQFTKALYFLRKQMDLVLRDLEEEGEET